MEECPRCNLPMQRHVGRNGQIFYKCPICGHEEDTRDLDVAPYNNWEVNSDKEL